MLPLLVSKKLTNILGDGDTVQSIDELVNAADGSILKSNEYQPDLEDLLFAINLKALKPTHFQLPPAGVTDTFSKAEVAMRPYARITRARITNEKRPAATVHSDALDG